MADFHKNTLVTARAGSGKTRVIVAKIAFLVAKKGLQLTEIAAFMFNRAAAAEVNQRIASVLVNGQTLLALSAQHQKTRGQRSASGRENILLEDNDNCRAKDTKAQSELEPNRQKSRQTKNKEPVAQVASTFHKFALDLMKMAGMRPQIVGESEHDQLISQLLVKHLRRKNLHLSPQQKAEYLRLISSFITRAGQKFPGQDGLNELQGQITQLCRQEGPLASLYQILIQIYKDYLKELTFPRIDFNLLMSHATRLLRDVADSQGENMLSRVSAKAHRSQASAVKPTTMDSANFTEVYQQVSKYKYLLVDEYQDFSYLFFEIIAATRQICPAAHLFAVGDDWQAINRFAGSDCDYFINFSQYFSEDTINIPLATNYRSDRRIVEHANDFMLAHYDPTAIRAIPFRKKQGRIQHANPAKIRFNHTDILEDGLGDGEYQLAFSVAPSLERSHEPSFSQNSPREPPKFPTELAKLLKLVVKIIKKHRRANFMLLHRHNFTSFEGVDLPIFQAALRRILLSQGIMTSDEFEQRIRVMTMHKSKGLEADVVILLEFNREIIASTHPHATIFPFFGDNLQNEKADQQRLIYVALTRAKHHLYVLSTDRRPLA